MHRTHTLMTIDDENLSGVERLKKRRRILADTTSQPLPVSSRIDIEIDRYLNMPEEECDDPLDWWRENKGSFVILRKLAAEILSIPASSASSERAFSAGTRVRSFNWNKEESYFILMISGLLIPETQNRPSDHL